jgi:DNA topoisomerase-3
MLTGLINACDAGREGELIFNYIAQHTKSGKPVQRLWLQSMTQGAIRDGFSRLRDGKEMQGLGDAAVCRSESDWLVGINGTRAMTAFNSKTGGFHLTTVGRVQTPTLAIVVEREKKIREFKARSYWEVEGDLPPRPATTPASGSTKPSRARRTTNTPAPTASGSNPARDAIRAATLGKPGIVTEEAKPETRLSPLLFDLTSLQREANGRFGFSAKTTLVAGASPLRKAQGTDLPAYRLALPAGRLLPTVKATLDTDRRRRRQGPRRGAARPLLAFRPPDSGAQLGNCRTSASSTTPRSATTSRSSRRRRHRKT